MALLALIEAIAQELGPEQARETKNTLVKILGNIARRPEESKFRSLRKSNKFIEDKILRSDAAISVLLAVGFEDQGDVLHCPETANLTQMRLVLDLLNAEPLSEETSTGCIKDIQAHPKSAQVTKVPSAPSTQSTSTFANRLTADVSGAPHLEAQVSPQNDERRTQPQTLPKLPSEPQSEAAKAHPGNNISKGTLGVSDQHGVTVAPETAASTQQAQTQRASSSSKEIDFRSLTIPELEARLRKLGISSSGCSGKSALVALLQEHTARQVLADRTAPPGDEFRGLSVEFISDGLIADLNVLSTEKVYEIEPRLREKGQHHTCPRDGRPGAAYVDVAADPDAGRATHMLSYGWGYRVCAIANALDSFCSQQGFNKRQVRVWICCICVNQHRVKEASAKGEVIPFETFQAVFGGRVSGIGRILALLAPWDKPLYITRVWCVYELYTAVTTENVKLDIIIPTEEQESFRHSLVDNGVARAVWDTIKSVKVQNAQASVEEDKRRILALIQEPNGPGFTCLNHTVMKQLQMWFTDTSAMHLEERIASNDFPQEMQSLCVEVSELMGELGIRERNLQAVRLLELALALPCMLANKPASAAMHCQLGQRLIALEQFANAARELKKAHDIYEESAMNVERGTVLIVVVGLYTRFGDMKSVQCAHEQGKAVFAEHPEHLAKLYQQTAGVYLAQRIALLNPLQGLSQESDAATQAEQAKTSKDVALAVGWLESAEQLYKQVGRVDTIEYVTCATELANAYTQQAEAWAGNLQTRVGQRTSDDALASAEEYLDRAWSSLDAIGMTESLNAARVLMARHRVGILRRQMHGNELNGLFGGFMDSISAMAELRDSEDYKRAVEITEGCGFKEGDLDPSRMQDLSSTYGAAFRDIFANGLDPANMSEHFGNIGDSFGTALAQSSERPVLPSWGAWTHPSLKQCADVSELAGQVISIVSVRMDHMMRPLPEDLDAEDATLRKLCQELLTKLPEQNTTAASSARGTVWIEYLHWVKACTEQLGNRATQALLRDQKEELTRFAKQGLEFANNLVGMFSSLGGGMGKGKGKGMGGPEDMLGGMGDLFGALGKGQGKGKGGPEDMLGGMGDLFGALGKGQGKGKGGSDASSEVCCIQ